jgi:hypothetical protein
MRCQFVLAGGNPPPARVTSGRASNAPFWQKPETTQMPRVAQRARSLSKLLAAGLIGLGLSASAASASTVSFLWTIASGGYSVSGWFTSLQDNTSGQSVTGVGIFASTLGGTGIYDVADAEKNKDFALSNGAILAGHLKFKKIGNQTIASPQIDFEMKWENSEIKIAKFQIDNGQRGGNFKLDFKADSGVFTVSEPLNYIPYTGLIQPQETQPVPVAAAALLSLSRLSVLSLIGWRRRARARTA